jgi:hypothetical protein
VPEGVKAIPLAATSPDPGDGVHSIGNAGQSGALWGYVKGTVRQVYRKKWKAELGPRKVATFEAKVVETDSATNHGDSGGPLLNDKGELVGVTEGGAVNAQLISTFVDVSEVKQVLATRAVRDLSGRESHREPSDDKESGPDRRDKPLTVSDGAKLFSADAVKAANEMLADLHKRGLDVLVETHPTAPKEWAEKAKTASPGERREMFERWARERLRAEKAHGFAVIRSLDPKYIVVEVPDDVRRKFPDGFAKKAGDAMIEAIKAEKYDDGLAAVLKLAKDEYKGDGK